MQKQEQIAVEDSNMALVGTQADKDARKGAAMTEKCWEGAGDEVGLQIWRVENKRTESDTPDFGVACWPKEEYGKFFKGDSYIMMNTYMGGETKDKKMYDIHFWIGAESSQDEYGVAAYKTVELDDLLGGDPIQHRECMDHETDLFMSYFPDGITLMEGGIESGFRKVGAKVYDAKLLQVSKQGSSIKVFEVPCTIDSLNTDDCFVLDAGAKIYVYHGAEASPFEKNKSTSYGENLESERGTGCERVDVDAKFWEMLGGSISDVKNSADKGGAPKEAVAHSPVLYSLEDSAWGKIKEGTLSYDDIADDDVMLIDIGTSLFVMVGSTAPREEQTQCMIMAQKFLDDNTLPNWTPIERVDVGKMRASTNASFKKVFGGAVIHSGWLMKKAGIRPLFQRHFFELNGQNLRFYEDESKSGSGLGAIDMADCSSVQGSVAPMSGAEEMEIVTSERTYRIKCDDPAELQDWIARLNAARKL